MKKKLCFVITCLGRAGAERVRKTAIGAGLGSFGHIPQSAVST